jgi:hypothetical protein
MEVEQRRPRRPDDGVAVELGLRRTVASAAPEAAARAGPTLQPPPPLVGSVEGWWRRMYGDGIRGVRRRQRGLAGGSAASPAGKSPPWIICIKTPHLNRDY